jgi:hypothetical protein
MTTKAQDLRKNMITAAKAWVAAKSISFGWSREARDLAIDSASEAFIAAEKAYETYLHGACVSCPDYAIQRAEHYATIA